jgi:hypothetical protein
MRYGIAVVLGSCAAAATGCASRSGTGDAAGGLPSGRFQIATAPVPSGGVAAYVLDTATGEVWMQNQAPRFHSPKVTTRPVGGR